MSNKNREHDSSCYFNNKKNGEKIELKLPDRTIRVLTYDWFHGGRSKTARRFLIDVGKPIPISDFMEMLNDGFVEKFKEKIKV